MTRIYVRKFEGGGRARDKVAVGVGTCGRGGRELGAGGGDADEGGWTAWARLRVRGGRGQLLGGWFGPK